MSLYNSGLYDSESVRALMTMTATQVHQACKMNNRLPTSGARVESATFVGMDDHGNFHYDIVFRLEDGGQQEDHVSVRYHRHEPSALTVPLAI